MYCSQNQICHLGTEAEFSSHFFDFMTHFFNNTNQHIRSQIWLLLINNFFRCAGSYETLQYLMITSVRIFYQRVQLSVGKGAGAALSELYIGLRVKNTIFQKLLYCF